MTRWEYHTERVTWDGFPKERAILKSMGDQGWELAGARNLPHDRDAWLLYFKRPIRD